jgi:hypothetical protein
MNTSLKVVHNNHRYWVLKNDRFVGALVTSPIRSYVYPFFAPSGANLLQEAPPDHPHQQGIFVGHDTLNGHNFWAMGHSKFPWHSQQKKDHQIETDSSGITMRLKLTWTTIDGKPLLDEERVVRFECWEKFHFLEISSTWIAAHEDLDIAKTKESGICMHVHNQLEPYWNGCLLSSDGKVNEKEIFDTKSKWIDVSGKVDGKEVGIVFMPHPSQEQVPWFVRDYGLQSYNPNRLESKMLKKGNQINLRVGFATYDGKSDGSQAGEAWTRYLSR